MKKIWTEYFPYFHLWIELPLFHIKTQLNTSGFTGHHEYISFSVKIWKWTFSFSFFDTYRRICARRNK